MAFSERETPEDFTPRPEIRAAIEERLADGKLACASAFAIVHAHDIEPLEVGWTANVMDVRLNRCQLGLFGYPGKQGWNNSNVPDLPVPAGMAEAIKAYGEAHDTLPCITAWDIASQFETSRMLVGYIADKLGVKITPCQLGAF
jgi:hypothetical protein